nr:DUF2892 domain-containing protein [uncultured Rhodopila sp.]
MTVNLGTVDRAARIVLGLALGAAGLGGFVGLIWGAGGILSLASGVSGFCPAYRLFGFRTCGDA